MILADVNVLIYAHRSGSPDHERYRAWLDEQRHAPAAFGVSDLVLSSFVRIVTHPRIFDPPTSLAVAFDFADSIRTQPNAVPVAPGRRHWGIFTDLCRSVGAKGNLVPDAYLAALAIETGSEWITTDRDYARFPGLRWRHPLG
ncbi:MAG: type II toxin-antitoxin system VapC family toxin [Acidimicrobiia bacterium]|nr:type II toxin-antitoxin system VapC family toxin [Acidimicrobiia bacterium]